MTTPEPENSDQRLDDESVAAQAMNVQQDDILLSEVIRELRTTEAPIAVIVESLELTPEKAGELISDWAEELFANVQGLQGRREIPKVRGEPCVSAYKSEPNERTKGGDDVIQMYLKEPNDLPSLEQMAGEPSEVRVTLECDSLGQRTGKILVLERQRGIGIHFNADKLGIVGTTLATEMVIAPASGSRGPILERDMLVKQVHFNEDGETVETTERTADMMEAKEATQAIPFEVLSAMDTFAGDINRYG